MKERSEEVAVWREKYHTLAQKSERFESLYEEERRRREKVEESWRESTGAFEEAKKNLDLLKEETEQWQKKSLELEENQKRLEKEQAHLSEGYESELKRLREENREMAAQLESAQRQVKDFMFRIEQQELIEKRTRLANELGAKETRLHELILETDRFRQEIQDRELQVQSLSGEQAEIERQILEIKQGQRHLLEQSKHKEKSARVRRPGHESQGAVD